MAHVATNPSTDGAPGLLTREIELVLATRENTANVGWMIDDEVPPTTKGIPFYKTVIEGANFEEADWKDQCCVRCAQIHWREDHSVSWLERHMEMTQGFVIMGRNPGLLVLGEPTHDRLDLSLEARQLPDPNTIKAYIVPPGFGIIIKKGTWHDFPVSCGAPVSAFVINTREVVAALQAKKEAGPMNEGDCFKLRMSDHWDFRMTFPDPRPFVQQRRLISPPLAKL